MKKNLFKYLITLPIFTMLTACGNTNLNPTPNPDPIEDGGGNQEGQDSQNPSDNDSGEKYTINFDEIAHDLGSGYQFNSADNIEELQGLFDDYTNGLVTSFTFSNSKVNTTDSPSVKGSSFTLGSAKADGYVNLVLDKEIKKIDFKIQRYFNYYSYNGGSAWNIDPNSTFIASSNSIGSSAATFTLPNASNDVPEVLTSSHTFTTPTKNLYVGSNGSGGTNYLDAARVLLKELTIYVA